MNVGVFSAGEFFQGKRAVIIPSAAAIITLILLAYFVPATIQSLHGLITAFLGIRVPFPWTYFAPLMPAMNVLSFLLGGIAIFLIGREYVVADRYTYFAVASYLLYFPLAGINWSTFTTLSLFPTLFLFGFYFYKIEVRWASALFFLTASATFVLYLFVVLLASVLILRTDRKKNILVRENYLPVLTILVTLLIFLMDASSGNFISYFGAVNPSGYGLLLGVVQSITFAKPLFFIVLLVPLITFAFFGPRILPVTIPYYLFGIITITAGTSPETLVAILDLIMPLAFIGSLRWIGTKVEMGIMPTETRIIRFALFSLILMNILVILTYVPFLKILGTLLGL